MLDVIESLMKGDDIYPRAFVSAKSFWDEFFSSHSQDNDQELQKAIDGAQLPFQWKMEKEAKLLAPFAKSIMALTAIGALYEDGFENRSLAERVIRCFTKSTTLSTGVKSFAEDVAQMYSLN